MREYKVGDKVKLMTEDQILKKYDSLKKVPFGIVYKMKPFLGKTLKIVNRELSRNRTVRYVYNLEGSHWSWTDEVFISPDDVIKRKIFNILTGNSNSQE